MLHIMTSHSMVKQKITFANYIDISMMQCEIAEPVFGSVTISGILDMYWKDCDSHGLAAAITCIAVRDVVYGAVTRMMTEPSTVRTSLERVSHIIRPEEQTFEVMPDDDEEDDAAPAKPERKPEIETATLITTTHLMTGTTRLMSGRHDLTITFADTVIPDNIATLPANELVTQAIIQTMTDILTMLDEYASVQMITIRQNIDAAKRITRYQPLPHAIMQILDVDLTDPELQERHAQHHAS